MKEIQENARENWRGNIGFCLTCDWLKKGWQVGGAIFLTNHRAKLNQFLMRGEPFDFDGGR